MIDALPIRQPPSMRLIAMTLERFGIPFTLPELRRLLAFEDPSFVVEIVEQLVAEGRPEVTVDAIAERGHEVVRQRARHERRSR